MAKNAYVIAGPNGAGKTTFAREFLASYARCPNFVNADLIAQGVSPFAPEKAAIRAGRLMLEEIGRLAAIGTDFGFETTLSGQTQLALWNRLKAHGYKIYLFYLLARRRCPSRGPHPRSRRRSRYSATNDSQAIFPLV